MRKPSRSRGELRLHLSDRPQHRAISQSPLSLRPIRGRLDDECAPGAHRGFRPQDPGPHPDTISIDLHVSRRSQQDDTSPAIFGIRQRPIRHRLEQTEVFPRYWAEESDVLILYGAKDLVPVFEKTSERETAHAVGCWK